MVYYNEIDPYAAQWLRNLIAAGHIASGVVDERSICDVDSADLADFTQCHFFAGIGVWSLALRRAGWPDDRPVWTGSCPCQPFSAAGKRDGFSDERHLWPHLFRLIAQRRPAVVFGEQVASRDGLEWLDLVQADLEGADYASAAVDICAAGVGAPHIRQRLYWVADADDARLEGRLAVRQRADERAAGPHGVADGLADADSEDQRGRRIQRPGQGDGAGVGAACERPAGFRADGGLANTESQRKAANELRRDSGERQQLEGAGARRNSCDDGRDVAQQPAAGPTNGHWADADWLHCRDGKWRPVEPGTFPLAHGATARVGRLRAYGNAIVPQVAEAVIRAYMQ
jgi:DNA (cytosine-5)-methyltransferase 1